MNGNGSSNATGSTDTNPSICRYEIFGDQFLQSHAGTTIVENDRL